MKRPPSIKAMNLLLAGMLLAYIIESTATGAEEATVDQLLERSTRAFNAGQTEEGLALCGRAIEADPKSAQAWMLRGRMHARLDQSAKAIADFDKVAALDSKDPSLFQYRGIEHFKLGHIEPSIEDFDRYIAAVPKSDPHHWQRGISYYYAGRYEEGMRQFERHQTVNAHDVENAVWHFLCTARAKDLAAARAGLIPIEGDGRVPMSQVHALFAGTTGPEAVLEAAEKGSAPDRERQLFYAHLYLGLYYEALGDDAQTRKHIREAAERSKGQNYMGAVARVHAARLEAPR